MDVGTPKRGAADRLLRITLFRRCVRFSVLFCFPVALEAQSVRGTVLDEDTNAPVEGATVTLLDARDDQGAIAGAVTDGAGTFVLSAARSGRYRLHITRIGYAETTSSPLDLLDNEEVEVRLHVSTVAVPVAPLTIVSDRPALLRSAWLEFMGFYERSRRYGHEGLGAGYFLERKDIERMTPFHITDALTTVPRLRVGSNSRGSRRTIRMRGGCRPEVYLDGSPINMSSYLGRDLEVDDLSIPPSLVEAVEVYYGSIRPAQFLPARTSCGAIVIWTRPG